MKALGAVLILGVSVLLSAKSLNFVNLSQTIIPPKTGYSNAGRINQTVRFLADQLSQNKDFANISDSKVAITSFVNIENLRETNKLGNLISEHLIHDMQIRGYRVVDYKAMPDIEIGAKGDYAFSREVKSLKQDFSLNYVLTGTYTYYRDGVSLNARMIDVQTNIVVSSAQAFIPKADLRGIGDSMAPYENISQTGIVGDMGSMGMGGDTVGGISSNYIIPGTEGSSVKIKRATF